jgi:type II secretory pathway pseudopilin PulG
MNRRSAFTILEVLVSVVLLAVVVGVCVQFMRAPVDTGSPSELSEFNFQIDEAIARFKLSSPDEPTLEQLTEICRPLGLRCSLTGEPNTELDGQWVVVGDERFQTLRWVRVEVEVSP